MDPQNHITVLLPPPRHSQSSPLLHQHIDSHTQFHSSVYSIYSSPNHSDDMSRSKCRVQPPRPPNSWILYRSDKIKELGQLDPPRPQAAASKIISEMWAKESELVRAHYEKLADLKKVEHQQKYPHYRFQPVKKDKRRGKLGTNKQKQVEKPRKTASYPSATPHASPASLVPAYFIAAPPPIPYFGAFSLATYSEQMGPSPPLSAASSNASSPNSFSTMPLVPEPTYQPAPLTIPMDSYSMLPSQSMSSNPSTGSTSSRTSHTPSFSTSMLPAMPPLSQDLSPVDDLLDWPPSLSQDWNQPSLMTWSDTTSQSVASLGPPLDQKLSIELGELQELPTFVSLEMPSLQPAQPGAQTWNQEKTTTDFLEAVLSTTGDPSIFHLSFDPSGLTNPPPDGLNVSHATLGDPSLIHSWLPTFDASHDDYSKAVQEATYSTSNISDEVTLQQQEEMLQYLDFNYQSDYHSPGDNTTSSSTSASYPTPVASSSTYVPPSGALNAGRRVVAGSWKPLGISMVESPPSSPVEHTTTQWGVRAVS